MMMKAIEASERETIILTLKIERKGGIQEGAKERKGTV
jgi:hypothetical protein